MIPGMVPIAKSARTLGINTSQDDVVLTDELGFSGSDINVPIEIYIKSGVIVGSTALDIPTVDHLPSLDITGLGSETRFLIVNEGRIAGAGGNGGDGARAGEGDEFSGAGGGGAGALFGEGGLGVAGRTGADGDDGDANNGGLGGSPVKSATGDSNAPGQEGLKGGDAVLAEKDAYLTIVNGSGEIWGGGGGGGAGATWGDFLPEANDAGSGGKGGDPGEAGDPGEDKPGGAFYWPPGYAPKAGGAAGNAIGGKPTITWVSGETSPNVKGSVT